MPGRARSPFDAGLLTIEICEDGVATRCVLSGEIDISNVDEVRAALGRLHVAGHRQVLVDLSDVRFLGVVGMRTLMETHAAFRAEEREFAVVGASPSIRRMFVLAGVSPPLRVSAQE
jgi:anti-sigma B factor antagonist